MLKYFPEIKSRLKKEVHSYNDHWKEYKLSAIHSINHFSTLPLSVLEEFHFKFQILTFEAGAKIFHRGSECD